MVLNKEKRASLTNVVARRPGAPRVASASPPPAPISTAAAPSPTPFAPIAAVPLTAVQASPAPTLLEKGKGVVEIESDEDSAEGSVFKRRRAMVAATSHSTTADRPASFKEHPPSASSPHDPLALEGGGESTPGDGQTPPAPELPVVLQHTLKGFQRGAAVEVGEDMARERLGLGFGELLAQTIAYIDKAEAMKEQLALVEAKAKEDLALAEEKKKEELAQLVLIFTNQETALDLEISSLHQTEKVIKKRLYDKGQEYTDLESKVFR